MIDQELLNILACPFCKSEVKLEKEIISCLNTECGCQYPVENDIPIMLIDRAKRPCPKCGQEREWIEEEDLIKCPQCNTNLKYKSR